MRRILRDNDRGGYTVPDQGPLPVPVELGFGLRRAWLRDLRPGPRLARNRDPARRAVGRRDDPAHHLPQDDDGYFPGPECGRTKSAPPTSGITAAAGARHRGAPPVRAVRRRRAGPLRRWSQAVDRWHRWFPDRATRTAGAIAIDPPLGDRPGQPAGLGRALSAVDAANVGPFKRRDPGHVDAAMRPTKEQYDRYIALVEFGSASTGTRRIARDRPFFVADPGMTAILRVPTAICRGWPSRSARGAAPGEIAPGSPAPTGAARLWKPELGGLCHARCAHRRARHGGLRGVLPRLSAGLGRARRPAADHFERLPTRPVHGCPAATRTIRTSTRCVTGAARSGSSSTG